MNTIAPGGAVPGKPDKMFEFKRVRLNVQGMMASAREYEALRTKDGVEVSIYDGPWSYNDNITREDCLQSRRKGGDKLYYEIAEFFYEIGIEKWDGFCKSNPDVLDGYSFSFEAETIDGKKISARGSNSYPSNYGKFEDYLWGLLH
ncbi:MAG: hypothetical protein II918_07360 [Firmicutes bacterium]|nr:hypothetical protein [Bacillota bacterium]